MLYVKVGIAQSAACADQGRRDPVGVVLNVVCGVSRITMEDIIKGVWPFMIAQLIVLFLLVLFRCS